MNAISTINNKIMKPGGGASTAVTLPTPKYWYMFRTSDFSGTTVTNLGTGSNDATVSNTNVLTGPSKYAGANRFSLKTSQGWLTETSHQAFSSAGMAMCYWINYNSLLLGGNPTALFGGNSANALLTQMTTNSQNNGYVNEMYFYIYGGNGQPDFQTGHPIPQNTYLAYHNWCHVCLTMNSTTSYLYLNGTLVASKSGGFGGWTAYVGSNSFLGGGANGLDAYMDDFRLYNSFLSAAQVAAVYNYSGNGPQI